MNVVDFFLHLPTPLLQQWGYAILAVVVFLEAFPLIGALAPGQTLIIVAGFFARLHILDLSMIMWISVLGAILGDFASYGVGRFYGLAFLNRVGKYFSIKPEHLEKTRQLIHEHLGKALIIGRFNFITRPLAPFLAGTTQGNFGRFLVFNIIGGIVWGATSVLVGYIFGASYEVVGRYIGRATFITLLAGIVFIYCYYLLKKKGIWDKFYFHIIMLNVGSLYVLGKMTEDVFNNEAMVKLDVLVNRSVPSIWQAWLTPIMRGLTTVFSPEVILVVSALLVGWFIYQKKWEHFWLITFGLGGGAILMSVAKVIMDRPRPVGALIAETGFSFPSGHATMAMLFFALLIYCFEDTIKNNIARELFVFFNCVMVGLIGFTRVYLGVHWLSDVIAGLALGLCWLTLLILLFRGVEGYRLSHADWRARTKASPKIT